MTYIRRAGAWCATRGFCAESEDQSRTIPHIEKTKQSLVALLQFFFVLVVGIAAQSNKLHDVHIAQCAAEIFGVFQNLFLCGNALFGGQFDSGLLSNLLAIESCCLNAFLRALVQVCDFLL